MDPISHAFVGISIAAFSGEPLSISNPIVIGSMLGAIIPDGDAIMQLKGHYSYLKNHRGVSHSIFVLPIFAGLITACLSIMFNQENLLKVFIFTLMGCLSHIMLDIMNTYGARIFWPVFKKRITLNLLLVYDPIVVISSLLIIIPKLRSMVSPYLTIALFILYFFMRFIMKLSVTKYVNKELGQKYKVNYIKVLPSMIGFFRWHFIIVANDKKVIGELNFLPFKVRILDIMNNIDDELYDLALSTPLAKFFKEFTPIFHVKYEKRNNDYIFRFIDLRYKIAEEYVHNATAVINSNFEVSSSWFHPYKITKNVEV